MILSIECISFIMSKIDQINNINKLGERLERFISFKESIHLDINNELDELFSSIDLKSSKKEESKNLENKVVQLSFGIDQDKEDMFSKELLLNYIEEEINNLEWYEQEVVRLYIKLGNYRAVGKETGIPYTTIFKTIRKVFDRIKVGSKNVLN